MSFADEVKSVTSSVEYKGTEQFNMEAPKPPAIAPESATPALSQGKSPLSPEGVKEAQAALPTATNPEAKEPTVKIGDREFASVQEAYIYAREEAAKAQGKLEAFDKMSQPKAEPAPVTEAWEKQMEQLMFTNPAEAIKQIHAKATSDAILTLTNQQQAQAIKEAKDKQYEGFMQDLVSENAELADFRTVIENVVLADQKFWNSVKDLPLQEAKNKIADQTRQLLKIRKEATTRQTEMPAGHAQIPGSMGSPSVATNIVASDVPVDFVTQLRKANKHKK